MTAPMITIALPWESPPLRSNNRLTRYPKAQVTAQIRLAGKLAARPHAAAHGTISHPVRVRFVWTVTDHRRRDAGASTPTLKAALDGLVDAGLLPGDHHAVVPEESCRIELGTAAACRIEITPDTERPTT